MRLFSVSRRMRFGIALLCALTALVWQIERQPRQAAHAQSGSSTGAFAIAKKLVAADGQAFDFFGAVAISGDTMAVGAKGSTPASSFGNRWSQGAVYIFVRQGGDWVLVKKLLAPDGEAGDQFGCALALEGDTLVVGAPDHDLDGVIDRGAAYVFGRNQGGAGNWGLVKELSVADGQPGDQFGNAVAINGSLIVVGAAYDDRAGTGSDTGGTVVDAGSAYIFERNLGGADNWGLLKVLGLNFYRDFQHFGAAVAVSGNTVAVGAPGDEVASFAGRGSVFVFERDLGGDNNWGVQPAVLAPDGLAGDAFGSALALEGNLLLVGAPLVDDGADQGAAYLYSRNAGGADNWGVIKKFTAADGADSDFYGKAVALKGDLILIGAPGDDVIGNTDQGSAFVYGRNAGGPGKWGLLKQLFASDGKGGTFQQRWNDQTAFVNQLFVNTGTNLGLDNFGDSFGNGVAIGNGVLAVGAMGADVGQNEEQGAAYLFVPAAFALNTDRLADGVSGQEYSQSVTPANATSPFSVLVTQGSLPPGLTLDSATGVISGIPKASGDYLFFLTVMNAAGQKVTSLYGISIKSPIITIDPAKLPDGRVGKPYKQTLVVTSEPVSNGPFTFTTNEVLPTGLTLSKSGVISGTPRLTGNRTFTVTVTDAYGNTATRTYTLRISF